MGEIADPGSGAAGPGSGATGAGSQVGGGGSGNNGGPGAGVTTAPPGPNLRLLTASQYRATLRTLFPFAEELSYDELEEDVALNGLRAIGAANVALSLKATEAYQYVAEQAAARAFADSATGSAFAGCDPAIPGCAESFIADFGRRAFRRSLKADEKARFLGIYASGVQKLASGAAGLKYAVMAMLGSPHFLYRVELGEPPAGGVTARVLTDVEVASKLAYFLWNSPPDDQLLDLAESGSLKGSLAREAARLLGAAELRAGLESLFDDYFSLVNLASAAKSSDFPEFTPELVRAMRQETLLNLDSAARGGADFRSVFNARKTFVNGELARLYGVAGVTGEDFVQVDLPAGTARRGLLGNASLLSIHSHAAMSSPTLRGKFVREMLLCQSIPAPPPDVDTTLPDTSAAATTRERFALHRTEPACAGCHQLMDPVGLGLENFDAIGKYRVEENGTRIDASGELDGVAFSGPEGLADALAQHPELPGCLSRTVFRYAWGRLENEADEAFIAELTTAFQAGSYRMSELLASAVGSPSFVNVGELD